METFTILTGAGVISQPGVTEDKWFILFFKCWYVSSSSVQSITMEDAAELRNLCVFYSKNSAEMLIYEVIVPLCARPCG